MMMWKTKSCRHNKVGQKEEGPVKEEAGQEGVKSPSVLSCFLFLFFLSLQVYLDNKIVVDEDGQTCLSYTSVLTEFKR